MEKLPSMTSNQLSLTVEEVQFIPQSRSSHYFLIHVYANHQAPPWLPHLGVI
jgi:hypothetical protein